MGEDWGDYLEQESTGKAGRVSNAVMPADVDAGGSKKVCFLVPSYGYAPCMEFLESALFTNFLLPHNGISTVWRSVGGDPYVHHARNRLAMEFLVNHKDADRAFFLDDDLGWDAEAVLRCINRPEDVIAGIYPKKNDVGEWPVELEAGAIEKGGLYKANLVPTGFLCIRRHVLEKLSEDAGTYPCEDPQSGLIPVWDFFRTGYIPFDEKAPKRGRWWGEDFFFSVLARSAGFEVWVDPDIRFTHRGSYLWSGKFRNALEERIAAINGTSRVYEDTPAIKRWGEPSDLGALVSMALDRALVGGSYLPREALMVNGMVGIRYRMFINNLMHSLSRVHYLEIGSYQGASAVAACHGIKKAQATCIDNWSMFGGPREKFRENMTDYEYTLLDCDFRDAKYSQIGKHNVFLYDGPHREKDQYDGITMAQPALTDEYVLIVDDWNWDEVRSGAFSALRDTGQTIVSAIEIRTIDKSAAKIDGTASDWHNGYLIAVVRKAAVAMAEAAE